MRNSCTPARSLQREIIFPHETLSAPMTVRSPPKQKRSAVRAGGINMPTRRKKAHWPRCGAKLAA
eukprot:6967293-Alexandrium_andersonii.AAC.1